MGTPCVYRCIIVTTYATLCTQKTLETVDWFVRLPADSTKAALPEPSPKCTVKAFFCLEFCSMARGLLSVHTQLLRRTDGSHPCLAHPAQRSNAPGLEDCLMAAGGVLRGMRPLHGKKPFSLSSLLCKAFLKGM